MPKRKVPVSDIRLLAHAVKVASELAAHNKTLSDGTAKVAADLVAHNARLSEALEAHDRLDTERFSRLTTTLEEIAVDVKSLLGSRSFARGVGKTVAAAAGSGGLVSLLFEIYRRLHP